jgi:nucleotide-binding universal stress UspA family protein
MKILLATDGSPRSTPPVQAAASRPWPPGSVVRILTVVEVPLPLGPEAAIPANYADMADALRADADQAVQNARATVAKSGLAVETTVRDGKAAREIVEEAEAWGADLILLGSHGRTGLTRVLLGSVAEYVVSRAPCSVEVVREANVKRSDS